MKKCINCGVELERSMNFCPLCGEPVLDEDSNNTEYIKVRLKERRELTDFQRLTSDQKRKLFWEISGIILISGIIITLIIDFLSDHSLSWSKYPLAICSILFINITLISFFYQNHFFVLSGSFISSSTLLILLDLFTGELNWGISLGIPLLFGAYFVVYVLIILIKRSKNKGMNIIAYSLLATGLLSIVTEAFISKYRIKELHLEWSLIVMASILPIAGLLLYLHFRLRRGRDLTRFFHI